MQGTKHKMYTDDNTPVAVAKVAKTATDDAPPGCVAIMTGTPALPYDVCTPFREAGVPPDAAAIAHGHMLPKALFGADGRGPSVLVYSIDFEGTGADHTRHYPNQWGGVAFACLPRPDGKGRAWYAVSCFNAAMAAPSAAHGFDPERKAQFWDKPENAAHLAKLQREAQPPDLVTRAFFAWLDSFRAELYVDISDLPQYDSAWKDHLHAQYTTKGGPAFLRYKQMHFAICTDSVMRAVMGDALAPWVDTAKVCAMAGVEYFKPEHEHDAVYDAYGIGVNYLRVAAAKGWLDRYLQEPAPVPVPVVAKPANLWYGRGVVLDNMLRHVAMSSHVAATNNNWPACGAVLEAAAKQTQAALDSWARVWFPGKSPAEHKAHATVLYHGPNGADVLRAARLSDKYKHTLAGTLTHVEKHAGNVDADGYPSGHFITICFKCDDDALQHEYAKLRKEAEALANAPSWQKPHLAADGSSIHVNDVNPHITVAAYRVAPLPDTATDAERQVAHAAVAALANAEFAAMQAAGAFVSWHGERIMLLPLEEH